MVDVYNVTQVYALNREYESSNTQVHWQERKDTQPLPSLRQIMDSHGCASASQSRKISAILHVFPESVLTKASFHLKEQD